MASSNIKQINLALQGGGAHGAFTWGVLDKILEDGRLDIEGVSGTSAGAINFWTKLSDLGRFSPIQRNPFSKLSGDWSLDYSPGRMIFDAFTGTFSPYEFNPMNMNPLLDLLRSEIDFDHVHACQNFELFICATNVRSGKTKRELRTVEFVSRLIDEGKLSSDEYMRVKMHAIEPAQQMQDLSSSSKLNLELEFLKNQA